MSKKSYSSSKKPSGKGGNAERNANLLMMGAKANTKRQRNARAEKIGKHLAGQM